MKTYVINLDRAPERMVSMSAKLAQYSLNFERIAAFDGSKISLEQAQQMQLPPSQRRYWLKDMTKGEIACFESHRIAWKRLLNSEEQWACILEDDVKFSQDPRPFMQDDWIPQDAKIIQLAKEQDIPHEIYRLPEQLDVMDGQFKLQVVIKHQHCAGGTQGYIIHRDAAKYLLDSFPLIPCPVDDFLLYCASPVRKQYQAYFLTPALILSDDQGVSFLKSDKAKVKTPILRNPIKYIERKLIQRHFKKMCKNQCVKDVR